MTARRRKVSISSSKISRWCSFCAFANAGDSRRLARRAENAAPATAGDRGRGREAQAASERRLPACSALVPASSQKVDTSGTPHLLRRRMRKRSALLLLPRGGSRGAGREEAQELGGGGGLVAVNPARGGREGSAAGARRHPGKSPLLRELLRRRRRAAAAGACEGGPGALPGRGGALALGDSLRRSALPHRKLPPGRRRALPVLVDRPHISSPARRGAPRGRRGREAQAAHPGYQQLRWVWGHGA